MHKEVKEVIDVCDIIITKIKDTTEIAEALKEVVKEIEQNTEQADVPNKSLAMRKPLSSLFILNSNFDDLLKDFEKIYDNFKKI